jgi:hypothetical protein
MWFPLTVVSSFEHAVRIRNSNSNPGSNIQVWIVSLITVFKPSLVENTQSTRSPMTFAQIVVGYLANYVGDLVMVSSRSLIQQQTIITFGWLHRHIVFISSGTTRKLFRWQHFSLHFVG